VVDDEEEMRNFLRDVLVSQDFSVRVLGSGQEAIDQIPALKPDLILLDLMMTAVDGVAVCKAIRTNQKTGSIPILVVTGSLSNQQIEESMTSGADDFISKPIDVQDMLIRIRALLKWKDITDPIDRLSHYVETVREMSEASSPRTLSGGDQAIV
jgi:DNA-binding response OmpR family regulator